jgi:integrase
MTTTPFTDLFPRDTLEVLSSGPPSKGTVLITPDQDKTYQERRIALPAQLVETLDRLKGPCYLWERYVDDSAVFRPGRRRKTEFSPAVMYHAVQSIFKEYGRACPEHKVKTHDFRRRAITLTAAALNGNWDAVSAAIPVTAETARKAYLDQKVATDAAAVQRQMAPMLLPKRPQAEV